MSNATNEIRTMPATASINAKYTCTDRPPQLMSSRVSFHPATIRIGISTAVSTTRANAIPSTPSWYPVPNDGIQRWDSTNWNCAPAGSKPTATTTVTASTASETPNATHLTSSRCAAGRAITATAPTIGTAHNTVSQGIELTTGSPPESSRPPAWRPPASTTHTIGRSRSACSATLGISATPRPPGLRPRRRPLRRRSRPVPR